MATTTTFTDDAAGYLAVEALPTQPIDGQKPGTSGLRKKTKVFTSGLYLHNFVQAIFDALPPGEVRGKTLVVSGDGRYYCKEATQVIIKIAAANGVGRVWVGKDAIMSTPAVSAVIRGREGGIAYGGILLTASHNPGGPDEDFGIKYNVQNGGPAPEAVTDAIYAATKSITRVLTCPRLPDVDLGVLGVTTFVRGAASGAGVADTFTVEVVDPVADYADLMGTLFDWGALRALVGRPDFSLVYDGLSGVAGSYATGILGGVLGVPSDRLRNCVTLPDFGGHHPDPNLTYASELVAAMGLTPQGTPAPGADRAALPDFGAAQDGDADRNMVLGKAFFVTPSDSVAVIAARASAIPFFARAGGLKGVARSMPTSAALDRVAAKQGIPLFEVPTGWKFFGNLMDEPQYCPFLCGEESFGTGSNHVREKDGLWAVLAWLSILADANKDTPIGQLVSVEDIVRSHWATYGRNFYCRYDYENVDSAAAEAMMAHLRSLVAGGPGAVGALPGGYTLAVADEFTYTDPVDGSVSARQGLRFIMADGSRVVYRLSGTGSVGATVRVYIEKYEPDAAKHDVPTADALRDLVTIATQTLGRVAHFTGRTEPTVIT